MVVEKGAAVEGWWQKKQGQWLQRQFHAETSINSGGRQRGQNQVVAVVKAVEDNHNDNGTSKKDNAC
jgi:hypothetical protein